MDADDRHIPPLPSLNLEFKKLLDEILHPDIVNIPKSETRYDQRKDAYNRTVMNANGDMIPRVDICVGPSTPYTYYFSAREMEKMARNLIFVSAFEKLLAGADLWTRNKHGKNFLQLYRKYMPDLAFVVNNISLSSYLKPLASHPEVSEFLKAYERRFNRNKKITEIASWVLLIFAIAITTPLLARFAEPAVLLARQVARFFLESPFNFPQVGVLVGAFLTYGGIATLYGGKNKNGTVTKVVETMLTIVCMAYTALCLVNAVKSYKNGGYPVKNELPKSFNECKMENKPIEKPTYLFSTDHALKVPGGKKAFSCSREMYKYASRLTEQRISCVRHQAFQNRVPRVQLKLPAKC
jgi:hypothetical protein